LQNRIDLVDAHEERRAVRVDALCYNFAAGIPVDMNRYAEFVTCALNRADFSHALIPPSQSALTTLERLAVT
jgi:hypothetical protein